MKFGTVIFYITNKGLALAKRLNEFYPDAQILKFKTKIVSKLWNECKTLIFVMSAGIVVRAIAALIQDKKTDPAVIVLDEKGEFVISLLSGHIGGANETAKEIANFLGGRAVITTASDVNNMTSIDLWARENNLVIENWDVLPKISARFLNSSGLKVYSDVEIGLPDDFLKVSEPKLADALITNKQKIDSNVVPVQTGTRKGKAKEPDSCWSLSRTQIRDRNDKKQADCRLYLRPKNLIIGLGCNSRTPADEIEDAVKAALGENNLSFLSVKSIATIDKKGAEPGLLLFAVKHGIGINTFTPDELNSVDGIKKSQTVFEATGAFAVSEPAALLAAGADRLLIPKQKKGNVTVAAAEEKSEDSPIRRLVRAQADSLRRAEARNQKLPPHSSLAKGGLRGVGKIYIVGTGPGSIEHITPYAQDVIKKSDIIVGYGTYIDLIQGLLKNKEVISTGMTQEVDRCKKAVALALSGKTVSVISGGDPGIYAMAGLVFEILKGRRFTIQDTGCRIQTEEKRASSCISHRVDYDMHHASRISVEVIPGISALNAAAAKLGAPLMHDFAAISLSDRLTPWKLIEKRLAAAAMADFVIVLYNPKSKGRAEHINRAREIILEHKDPDTPVGIVKAAMRDSETVFVTSLADMLKYDIDMQTTVIIGNSKTFTWNNLMITPRGYENKFKV